MKKTYLLLFLSFIFSSCGISEKQKARIEIAISLHNVQMLNLRTAEEIERSNDVMKFAKLYVELGHKTDEAIEIAQRKVDSINEVSGMNRKFPNNYVNGYDIREDTLLTFERYKKFCDDNKLDYEKTLDLLKKEKQ